MRVLNEGKENYPHFFYILLSKNLRISFIFYTFVPVIIKQLKTMDLFKIFIDKFNKDTHSVTLRTEDDYYSYAHAKFSQYTDEIAKEYNVSSEELDNGVEWYDEYHDEVVSEFCLLLN